MSPSLIQKCSPQDVAVACETGDFYTAVGGLRDQRNDIDGNGPIGARHEPALIIATMFGQLAIVTAILADPRFNVDVTNVRCSAPVSTLSDNGCYWTVKRLRSIPIFVVRECLFDVWCSPLQRR